MNKIKAVIFDMDGVLIDAKEWHYEALNRALGLFGYAISRYDHLVTYDGLPTRRKLEMLTKERGLPIGLHVFINELKQLYTMELVHAKCKPLFQHEYALSNLKAAGYKIGLASNSIRSTIEAMMVKSNLMEYIDLILSNQDVSHPKPHPEIYITAFNRLGVEPSEAIIVEDNENGIRAVRDSGGFLMAVADVHDVTFDNIMNYIAMIERVRA